MTDETISIPREPLIEYIKAYALEVGEMEAHTPEGCDDWSIKSMDVMNVEVEDDGLILVHGKDTGSVSERVARATRLNPPEYKNHDVPVFITIAWDLERVMKIDEVTITVSAEGGDPREPPAPDINAHRYDL